MVEQIVVADIGGTNARFALAVLEASRRPAISHITRLPVADYPGIAEAWRDFADMVDQPLPNRASIAIAAPMRGETLSFTNSSWTIPRHGLEHALGIDEALLLNDFGAAAHAVDVLEPAELEHIAGPDMPLPRAGVVSLVGPGTGLGGALLAYPPAGGPPLIVETECGHIGFAPQDATEEAIARIARDRYGRISTERLAAGPGLAIIHDGLAALAGAPATSLDDKALWAAAIAGEERTARAALDRFCRILGAVAGDIVLAQGGAALVLGGGIAPRIAAHLRAGGFAGCFTDKGRYRDYMAAIPIRMMTHPEPGLLGAAVAFARRPGK